MNHPLKIQMKTTKHLIWKGRKVIKKTSVLLLLISGISRSQAQNKPSPGKTAISASTAKTSKPSSANSPAGTISKSSMKSK